MSVISRARYALAKWLYKAGGLAIVPRWVDTTVLEPSWRALSRDGYSRNAAVFACVSTLSFDIPEPPLYCYTPSGEMLTQGPLARLLRRPNPLMSQRELMTLVTAYAAIGGNAYIHIVRDRRGQPVQLWPYHAGQMIPVPAGGPQALSWIERYDYDDGTGVDVPVPAQDVIHLRWPSVDPQQPWQALPPLAAAAAEVDAGNEVVRYIRALLKNDATPRVVLTTPTGAFLSDSTVERMKDQWRERYGGDGRGGVAVLEEGVTMQRLSLDMAEMAFDALVRVPEVHIAAAFRIPAIIAGLGAGLDASTYSNYKEARQAYTQQTLMPLWMAWSEELHIALAEPLGMEVRYDFSNIAALREDQNARSERTVQQWTSGLITRNEARLALGYPEDEYGGAVYLMPTNAMLVPVGMMETEGPAHEAQETPLIEEQEQEEEGPDDTPDDSPDDEGEEEYDDLPPEERNAPLAIETRMQPAREYVAPPIEDVATSAARRIRRYLSEQYRRAAEYVTQAEQMSIRAQKDLFAQLPLDFGDEIMEIMRQFYPLLLERAWDGAMNEIGMELRFDLENPKVQEVLHLLALEVRRVSDTTREEIRGIVGRMSSEGISYQQAALEIAQLAGINSQTRALTIAVTESARAFTQGSLLAWRESNEVEMIEWSAEPTACPICRAVNGTSVQLDRTFGGILPPAHPNCRCALLPVLRDEERPVITSPQPHETKPTFLPDGTYIPSLRAQRVYEQMTVGEEQDRLKLNEWRINNVASARADVKEIEYSIEDVQYRLRLGRDTMSDQEITSLQQRIKELQSDRRRAKRELTKAEKTYEELKSAYDNMYNKLGPGYRFMKTSESIVNDQADRRYNGLNRWAQRLFDNVSRRELLDSKITDEIGQVHEFIQSIIPARLPDGSVNHFGLSSSADYEIYFMQVGERAHASKNRYISLAIDNDQRVILHEFLHILEMENPVIADRVQRFYQRRTQNEQLQKLRDLTGIDAYRDDEVTRVDRFFHPYVGKDYGDKTSEVVSMWADIVSGKRVTDDPEHFMLIYDLLTDADSYIKPPIQLPLQ